MIPVSALVPVGLELIIYLRSDDLVGLELIIYLRSDDLVPFSVSFPFWFQDGIFRFSF